MNRFAIDPWPELALDTLDGEAEFGKEIRLLTLVAQVMNDAAGILARPDTGRRSRSPTRRIRSA